MDIEPTAPAHTLPTVSPLTVSMPHASSELEQQPLPVGTRCWINDCGQTIVGKTAGVKRHMETVHPDMVDDWKAQQENAVACPWSYQGQQCGAQVVVGEIMKHIAMTHLRAPVLACQYCNSIVSRQDAMLRHLRRDCRGIPEEERKLLGVGQWHCSKHKLIYTYRSFVQLPNAALAEGRAVHAISPRSSRLASCH